MSAIGNFSTLLYCSQFSLCIYCESLQYLYLCLYTSDVCKHCLTCVTNYNTHVYNKTNWLLIIFPMKNPECDEWFLISSKLKIQLYSSWRLRKYVKYIKNYAGVPIISIFNIRMLLQLATDIVPIIRVSLEEIGNV